MESSTRYASTLLDDPALNGAAPAWIRQAGIIGLGSCVPERILTNRDLESMVETSDEWILSRTGIRERRIAAPGETTSDLASRAATRALEDAGLEAAEIDLVIVATVTGDYPFPATSSLVQHRIGATRAAAFDLAAGCAGFIYALAVGAQFIQTGLYRHVLVVGAEVLSRIVDWSDRSTCVLFGDGAGAAVLGPTDAGAGFLAFDLGSDGSGAELLVVDAGGKGHSLTTGSNAERIQSIRMAGSEVFKFAVRVIDESTRRSLGRAGLGMPDLDLVVPHQANSRIIEAAGRRLGLEPERMYSNVHRYGNTSAASIPLALCEARQDDRLRSGDTVALVGFGAGLAWASCLLRWTGPGGER